MKLHVNALFLRIFSKTMNHKYIYIFSCRKIYAYWFFLMSHQAGCSEVFIKNGVMKLLQNALENTCAEISFLIRFLVGVLQLYLKGDPNADVSCKFWQTFKNSNFVEHLRTTAFLMSHQAEKTISRCRATASYFVLSSEEQAFVTS